MTRPWLTIAQCGLTGAEVGALLDRFGSAEAITAAGAAQLKTAGASDTVAQSLAQSGAGADSRYLQTAESWLAGDADRHLLTWADPRYPQLLREIADAPPVLFVRGDPLALALPQLAIVGSRNATAGGIETARAFAMHLAAQGLAITSGLALGIDAAAHAGALDAGGHTIAVLGTGPDQIYPRAHTELAGRIAGRGALCSEFLPGVAGLRDHFPRRNRIISALSVGTLVVEARLRSGALITARRAAEQGREVFAIPGSIHNPLAKGCHRLIREGAKLVESGADILEELAPLLGVANVRPTSAADPPDDAGRTDREQDPQYARLFAALGWDTVTVDAVVLRSGLTAAEVSSMLLILELEGSVQPLSSGRYQRQR